MTTRTIPPLPEETPLLTAAREWLNSEGKERDDGPAGAYKDLMHGGCAAGTVGELIYYSDTVPFYEQHRDEIGRLAAELAESVGEPIHKILSAFDESDPFATTDGNKNLLAWFGFEEAARRVAEHAGLEG